MPIQPPATCGMLRCVGCSARPALRRDDAAPRCGRHLRWTRRCLAAALLLAPTAGAAWAQNVLVTNNGGNGANGASKGKSGSNASSGGVVNTTNTTGITQTYTGWPNQWFEAASVGGNGGSAYNNGNDGNGNPDYDGGTGGSAGSGGAVTAVNQAQIAISTNGIAYSGGTRLVAAVSGGGTGGGGETNAPTAAQAGGSAASVTLSNYSNLSLSWTWSNTTNYSLGVEGLMGSSEAGAGANSATSQSNGGAGGTAAAVSVSQANSTIALTVGDIVSTNIGTQSFATPAISRGFAGSVGAFWPLVGAGVVASSRGGDGGNAYDRSTGGTGGAAGAASLAVQDSTISILAGPNAGSGAESVGGLVVVSTGGNGGSGGLGQDYSNGGAGGAGGTASLSVVSLSLPTVVSTNGQSAPVAIVGSVGGNGGSGTDYDNLNASGAGGNAGAGGSAAAVTVTVQNNVTFHAYGYSSPALVGISLGGDGGKGGDYNNGTAGSSGYGGAGGGAGGVSVSFGQSSIVTDYVFSPGLLAESLGGNGGNGGYAGVPLGATAGSGGDGGSAAAVAVTIQQGGSIATAGQGSAALAAISRGGDGGVGGSASALSATAGSGGDGGAAGNVTVANAGTLSTTGTNAQGILAESVSGNGGNAGDAGGVTAGASYGGNAGAAGSVGVTNTGTIVTTGAQSIGILALSLNGGGGAGGDASGAYALGGDGGKPADGGTVSVVPNGSISTSGDLAHGVLALSVGGGGGTAGNATAYSGVVAIAIGGTGGAGGDGGAVQVSSNNYAGSIQTYSSNAAGLVAMSVGGGGGTGGAGYALSGSIGFGAAIAVGGSGGNGGNGGSVALNLGSTRITTGLGVLDAVDPVVLPDNSWTSPLPVDSYGIVAASIGGGGGVGGSAAAKTYVLDMPIPETSSSIAIAATYANGGSGGVGGTGGPVTVDLPYADQVLTYGNGSHAIVAASIGGGGGLGGDSSALSTSFGFKIASKVAGHSNYNLDIAVSLGGTGGAGGDGGPVTVSLGAVDGVAFAGAAANPTVVQTLGDSADGVLARSIGGGGGNAGFGSGSTQNGTSASTAIKATIALGASGGGGGNGGDVAVYAMQNTSITTAGDSAYGIDAGSIGGGGGDSSGSSFQAGLPSINTVASFLGGNLPSGPTASASNITIKAGTDGGTGGNGGAVTVVLQNSHVTTTGEAATGILAQSIGGGGGVAGSAGSSGSSDDPTILEDLKATKKFVNGITTFLLDVKKAIESAGSAGGAVGKSLLALFPSYNFNLSFGASGGAGGNGGTVDVVATGSGITAQGDWARNIIAQSIGGGGGLGGAAVAGGSQGAGNLMKLNLNVALGGTGGSGGDGGAVDVTLGGSTLSTAGYAGFNVLAQSIGGGGGDVGSAEVNSSGYFSLGVAGNTTASTGGNGGSVTLTQSGSSISRLSTTGDAAHSILLQSIGGGGGTAGEGYTLSASIIGFDSPYTTSINVGSTGGYGNGGKVSTDPANLPYLAITTTGAASYGILAQSIGGGGGLAFQNPGLIATSKVGGGTNQSANGGEVAIALHDGSSIATGGAGSYGIFAQSVGGGGGLGGYAAGAAQFYEAKPSDGQGYVTYGDGGPVTVTTGNSTITTTGAAAYGIFAQSVGAGGGVKPGNDGVSLIAGTTGAAGSSGAGGLVTVIQSGILSATGQNAIGIFAQSIGQIAYGIGASAGVQITVNGAVQGGSGSQGWGIWVDTDNTTNSITIAAGGSVTSVAQQAINATGWGVTNVTNNGTVTGSYDLQSDNSTRGTFSNMQAATLVASGTLTGDLVNAGRIAPSTGNGFATITVAGNFQQTATGVFAPNANFANRQADSLVVTGDAVLGGQVTPVITSVLPGIAIPVLTVNGSVSGSLTGGSSSLFGYGVSRSGNQLLLTATTANFAPASFALSAARTAVAEHLQSIWNAGGTPALGALFALLGNTADTSPAAYSAQLRQLSPDAVFAPGARAVANAHSFANNTLSCPSFKGTDAMLTEAQCGWMRITGRTASQSSGNGISDYHLDSATWQIGGQHEIAPDWLLGGSLAYEENWLASSDNLTKGNGQSGYAAVTLKHQTGPWLFAASAFGGGGQFNTSRAITLPGFASVAKGNPDTSNVGLLLRAAYTIGKETFYLRPSFSVSVIHVATGAYRETGAGTLDLSVDAASQTTGMATPMLELGGRISLQDDMVLRPFISAGVSFLSNDNWKQTGRLVSAPAGASGFATTVPMDPVVARVGAGVQLYTGKQIDLRLQYDGEYSTTVAAHAGSFVTSIRF